MSEMLKDLEMIDAEAAEFLLDSYPGRYVKHVAARLAELGYVKVVRCGECKFLAERTIAERILKKPLKMYVCTSPYSHMKGIARFDKGYYCSAGEPKEEDHE